MEEHRDNSLMFRRTTESLCKDRRWCSHALRSIAY